MERTGRERRATSTVRAGPPFTNTLAVKGFFTWLTSFVAGVPIALLLAWGLLGALIAISNPGRSSATGDIGPIFFPLVVSPLYFVAHPVVFLLLRRKMTLSRAWLISGGSTAAIYAVGVFLVAVLYGYHG